MSVLRYIGIAVALLFTATLALVGFLSLTRSAPVETVIAEGDKEGPPSVEDSLFTRTLELFTGTHIDGGNSVELLLDGQGTYPPLWRDLAGAKRTITVQMYFSEKGAVADSMARHLAERAKAGVRVLLLLDAFGSQDLKGDWVKNLRSTGVEVAWLRPFKWYTLHKAAQRSHVRAVVVDGEVGYTGGFGLADYWLGDGRHDGQWRETNVRFSGHSVAALQATFAAGWAEATGELLTGNMFFPRVSFSHAGSVKAGLIHTVPTIGSTSAERFLALTIAAARKTLYISNSYFVPDQDLRNQLKHAVRRGVDVRVVTASDKSDIKTTLYAGRASYEELLHAGVRIWEYQPTMMHAKTISVDGLWSTIGSMNFDNRSITFNNESNIVVLDASVGKRMDEMFLEDLRFSREIKLAEWRKRSLKSKVLERGASLLWRIL